MGINLNSICAYDLQDRTSATCYDRDYVCDGNSFKPLTQKEGAISL